MRYTMIYPAITLDGSRIYCLGECFYSWPEALAFKFANGRRVLVDVFGAEVIES